MVTARFTPEDKELVHGSSDFLASITIYDHVPLPMPLANCNKAAFAGSGGLSEDQDVASLLIQRGD
ncbi:MAG: hypothetical protein R2788_02765 [Saprospiraceae bacterium]